MNALQSSAAAATNPAVRTYGTLGRNAFRGPDRTNMDVSVAKNIYVYRESAKLEIRMDCFNCFNNTQFGNPNTTITNALFGQISTTYDPRIVQLSARFIF